MDIDAYKIAVQVSLVDNVTASLAGMSRNFLGVGKSTSALEGQLLKLELQLKKVKNVAMLGGGLMLAGGLGLKSLQGPLEEAKKYQNELAKLQAQGVGDKALLQADKFAKSQKIIGASARDTLKMLAESQSVLRDFSHAQEVTPMLLRMKFGIESVMSQGGHGGGHGAMAERMFMDALKVSELRGALNDPTTGKFDAHRFEQTLNFMTKAYTASGGLVKPTEYLNMIKTGGIAAKSASDQSFFFGLMHMMQEQGGNRTGTGLMSAFQNMYMGRTTQQVAEEMMHIGLLNKSQVHYGKTGHITKVEPGALKEAELFRTDQFKFMNQILLPQLRSGGVKDGSAMEMAIAKLFSNRTGGSQWLTMYKERANIEKHIGAAQNSLGINDLAKVGSKTLAGQQLQYEARLASLKLELGQKILPMAIAGLERLNAVLDKITTFTKNYPNLTKGIVVGLAALSGLALIGGGFMLIASGVRALALVLQFTGLSAITSPLATLGSWLMPGLRLLGQGVLFFGRALLFTPIGLIVAAIAAAVYLLYRNWATVGPYVIGTWNVIKAVFTVAWQYFSKTMIDIYTALKPFITVVKDIFFKVVDIIKGALGGVFSFVVNIVGFLWDKIKNSALGKAVGLVMGVTGSVVASGAKSTTDWANRVNNPSPYIASNSQKMVQVTTVTNLDSRPIAKSVSEHQAREMSRPNAGIAGFDGGISLQPVGLNITR